MCHFYRKGGCRASRCFSVEAFGAFRNLHMSFDVRQVVSDPQADAETDIWDSVD